MNFLNVKQLEPLQYDINPERAVSELIKFNTVIIIIVGALAPSVAKYNDIWILTNKHKI